MKIYKLEAKSTIKLNKANFKKIDKEKKIWIAILFKGKETMLFFMILFLLFYILLVLLFTQLIEYCFILLDEELEDPDESEDLAEPEESGDSAKPEEPEELEKSDGSDESEKSKESKKSGKLVKPIPSSSFTIEIKIQTHSSNKVR